MFSFLVKNKYLLIKYTWDLGDKEEKQVNSVSLLFYRCWGVDFSKSAFAICIHAVGTMCNMYTCSRNQCMWKKTICKSFRCHLIPISLNTDTETKLKYKEIFLLFYKSWYENIYILCIYHESIGNRKWDRLSDGKQYFI